MTRLEGLIAVFLMAAIVGIVAGAGIYGAPASHDPCAGGRFTFTPVAPNVVRRDCDARCFYSKGPMMTLVVCPEGAP